MVTGKVYNTAIITILFHCIESLKYSWLAFTGLNLLLLIPTVFCGVFFQKLIIMVTGEGGYLLNRRLRRYYRIACQYFIT